MPINPSAERVPESQTVFCNLLIVVGRIQKKGISAAPRMIAEWLKTAAESELSPPIGVQKHPKSLMKLSKTE